MLLINATNSEFSVLDAEAAFNVSSQTSVFDMSVTECSLVIENQISSSMETNDTSATSNAGIIIYDDISNYAGPYEADALFQDQTFETGQKRMTDDFKVNAINYTEAPNDSGVTVTIGG